MENAERTADDVPMTAQIPTTDASSTASAADISSRKRPREVDNEETRGQDESLPGPIEDDSSNKRSRIDDKDSAVDFKETAAASNAADTAHDESSTLSKNQLRKQRRQQKMEERREQRRLQRKDKRHEKSARKREEREAKAEELAQELGVDKAEALKRIRQNEHPERKKGTSHQPVPVAIIIDCDFEKYMFENELVSLGGQITRSYSMNRMGPYVAHLVVSSWCGKLKERFDTVLKAHHHQWRGVSFVEGDFVEGGRTAWSIMNSPQGGKPCPALGGEVLQDESEVPVKDDDNPETSNKGEGQAFDEQPAAPEFSTDSIVYLSADSPNTLQKLEPNTSYVIGGLVDRNREKNLCQRRAEEKGIRTAKLPIGEYLQMSSRKVLATNHVVEIMSKWLETGDWAQAFMAVIPKRKGGELKGGEEDEEEEADKGDDDENASNAVEQDDVGDGVSIQNGEKQNGGAIVAEA